MREILHQSPRLFGKASSVWTLELAAQVAHEQGVTAWRVSGETVRATLARMGVSWRRAKHWITHQPRPGVCPEKSATRPAEPPGPDPPDWLLGFEDEVWWSRLARPALHARQEEDRHLHLVEQSVASNDPDPKAEACYGLLARYFDAPHHWTEAMWRRIVDGRPISAVTIDFLTWCAAQAAALGKRAVLLI